MIPYLRLYPQYPLFFYSLFTIIPIPFSDLTLSVYRHLNNELSNSFAFSSTQLISCRHIKLRVNSALPPCNIGHFQFLPLSNNFLGFCPCNLKFIWFWTFMKNSTPCNLWKFRFTPL